MSCRDNLVTLHVYNLGSGLRESEFFISRNCNARGGDTYHRPAGRIVSIQERCDLRGNLGCARAGDTSARLRNARGVGHYGHLRKRVSQSSTEANYNHGIRFFAILIACGRAVRAVSEYLRGAFARLLGADSSKEEFELIRSCRDRAGFGNTLPMGDPEEARHWVCFHLRSCKNENPAHMLLTYALNSQNNYYMEDLL